MKTILNWLKWIIISIITVVLLILAPIGINNLYENIRAAFLTDQEKRDEDLSRLEYLFKNEFSGYGVLPNSNNFDKQLAALRQKVADNTSLDQDAFNMEVIKTVASFKDPHTGVYTFLDQRFPFSLTWSDGYFYLLAGQVDKQWLGAKVLTFDGTPASEVFEKISAYTTSPNEAGTAYFIRYFIPYEDPLYHEGIIADKATINLEVSLNGQTDKLTFNSMPSAEVSGLSDYNRISQTIGDRKLPLYRTNYEKNYWYDFNEAEQLLYLRYSLCVDQGDIEFFWDEFFEKLKEKQPEKLVIDVRGNPGGDAQSHNSFLTRIRKDTLVNKYGRLFTIIDGGVPNRFNSWTGFVA